MPDSKNVWADRRSCSSTPYLSGRLVSGICLAGLELDQREPGQPQQIGEQKNRRTDRTGKAADAKNKARSRLEEEKRCSMRNYGNCGNRGDTTIITKKDGAGRRNHTRCVV